MNKLKKQGKKTQAQKRAVCNGPFYRVNNSLSRAREYTKAKLLTLATKTQI